MPASESIEAEYSAESLAEQTAAALVAEHDIPQEEGESAIQALAWDLGDGALTYERGLTALVTKAVEIDRSRAAGLPGNDSAARG